MTETPSYAEVRDKQRYDLAKLEFIIAAQVMRKHLGKDALERLDPIIRALK